MRRRNGSPPLLSFVDADGYGGGGPHPSDAEDFRFSNANSGSESYLVSYVTAETRSTSLDIYWCDGCYLQVSCATGWRRIDKVSGIVRKSTTAVTTLSSFVPMPLGQHGSRKALNIGEAFVALP